MSDRKDSGKLNVELDTILKVGLFVGGVYVSYNLLSGIWNALPTQEEITDKAIQYTKIIAKSSNIGPLLIPPIIYDEFRDDPQFVDYYNFLISFSYYTLLFTQIATIPNVSKNKVLAFICLDIFGITLINGLRGEINFGENINFIVSQISFTLFKMVEYTIANKFIGLPIGAGHETFFFILLFYSLSYASYGFVQEEMDNIKNFVGTFWDTAKTAFLSIRNVVLTPELDMVIGSIFNIIMNLVPSCKSVDELIFVFHRTLLSIFNFGFTEIINTQKGTLDYVTDNHIIRSQITRRGIDFKLVIPSADFVFTYATSYDNSAIYTATSFAYLIDTNSNLLQIAPPNVNNSSPTQQTVVKNNSVQEIGF